VYEYLEKTGWFLRNINDYSGCIKNSDILDDVADNQLLRDSIPRHRVARKMFLSYYI
jgi:hypothetical protein